MDFMADRLGDGRAFRLLNVLDDVKNRISVLTAGPLLHRFREVKIASLCLKAAALKPEVEVMREQ